MIIWRIHALTDQLRSGRFSAQQVLPYLVSAVLLASLMLVFADWSRPWDRDDFETSIDSLTTLINGVISAFGLHACYRANGGVAGAQLAERICALGVVLFFRFLVWGVLALIFWAYVAGLWFESVDLISVLFVVLFWVQLRHYIRVVAVAR